MGFITWIAAGALLGGAAGALTGIGDRKGFGLYVATGIAGVLFGGWLFGKLIGASAYDPGEFGLGRMLVSMLGAAVLLAGLHEFRYFLYQSGRSSMQATPGVKRALRPMFTAGLAGILMLIGACASTPPAPQSALDAARVAILNADRAEAGQFAAAELGEARAKLALADNAVGDENTVVAEQYARGSQVQAELASR